MLENIIKQFTMSITQVEMLGKEYKEAKQKKNELEGLENKKNGAYK